MITLPRRCMKKSNRVVMVLLALVGVAALINGVVAWTGNDPPVTVSKSGAATVPTTGEQGFLVAGFCEDSHTTVAQGISPPDSTFAAYFTLDRRLNGVHEVVEVGVYADAGKMPAASHYDSANTRTDAFVDKTALGCILRKSK